MKNFFRQMSKHIVIGLAKYAMPQKFSMKDVRIESCDTVMRIDNCDYASFLGSAT